MNRVRLDFVRGPHPASVDAGHPVETARLFVDFSLASVNGWTSFQALVVDTGAAVSLLPRRLWEHARFVARGRARIGGLSRRPGCLIDATLAEVDCLISDGAAAMGPLRIYAYLADSEEVAALLGLSGILDRLVLHIDATGEGAYFESRMP